MAGHGGHDTPLQLSPAHADCKGRAKRLGRACDVLGTNVQRQRGAAATGMVFVARGAGRGGRARACSCMEAMAGGQAGKRRQRGVRHMTQREWGKLEDE